jgi:4-hydroxy-3-methylbut-2-enyl diphosphate reductase
VRELARRSDVVLVLGAENSSNSNRLKEIGENMDVPSYLIDDASVLDPAWVVGKAVVGITAGASAPEALVDELIAKLRTIADVEVEQLGGVTENIVFKLPHQLRDVAIAS